MYIVTQIIREQYTILFERKFLLVNSLANLILNSQLKQTLYNKKNIDFKIFISLYICLNM